MPELFNYSEGQRLKKIGMEAAASYPADEAVSIARNVAILLAKRNGETNADAVLEYMLSGSDVTRKAAETIRNHPNSFGSAFKSPLLKFTGRVVPSKRKERHCNFIKQWAYNGEGK